MLMCTVCGEWSPCVGGDRLDICEPCFTANFSGTQPPPDPWADPWREVTARAALEAYVDSSVQMTPRQVQAMHHIAARWVRELEDLLD